jgi:50S ribosomal protein L16 3-hydroxylase
MIDLHAPTPLLAGLSPHTFMRRHWQKRPLLVRGAWPGVQPPATRAELYALAAQEGVQARLVVREANGEGVDAWRVRHGPLPRRALPPVRRPGWTLLVQGLDLHRPAAHAMLAPFRFVPAARLDDLMASWASEGGGVGPHADSYDVFLLQVAGRRRWRVAPPGDGAFLPGLPLKILRRFEPVHDWLLEPGDMLYLPPGWGHDGVAEGGECITCSVGFRAPSAAELARELLQRLADVAGEAGEAGEATEAGDEDGDEDDGAGDAHRRAAAAKLYADASQPATASPGAVPEALQRFAARALAAALRDPQALPRALGELLSEPKAQVWFEGGRPLPAGAGVRLDVRTRMLHDARHIYINGESYRAAGRDARLLRRLADGGRLAGAELAQLSADALGCLRQWAEAGWVRAESPRPRGRTKET